MPLPTARGTGRSVPPFISTQLSEAERKLRSSAGAHISWGRTKDRAKRTAPGRRAAFKRFDEQARANLGDDAPAEAVLAAARNLEAAHLKLCALKSAKARRLKAAS